MRKVMRTGLKDKNIKELMVFLASIFVAGSALAQEPSTETESLVLEEVIVTATKRELSVQDVPISITTLTATDIENSGSESLRDIAGLIPNFIFPEGDNEGQSNIAIRGVFQQVSAASIGFDVGYGIYLDGVFLGAQSAANIDLGAVERIELLRGPQGTLFGKNTIAGAINIISQKPGNEFEGNVEVETGNYDLRRIRASVNIPIAEDVLAMRLSVGKVERDGYITNAFLGEDDINNIDQFSGRLLTSYTPTEDTRVSLNLDFLDSDRNGYGFERLVFDDVPFTIDRDIGHTDEKQDRGVGLNIENNFANGYTFTSVSSYRKTKFFPRWDGDLTSLDALWVDRNVQQRLLTQELRISSPADRWYDFVGGVYYFDQDLNKKIDQHIGVDWFGLSGEFGDEQNVGVKSAAAFIHANFHIGDKLTLFGGARYTDEKKTLTVEQYESDIDQMPGIGMYTLFGFPLGLLPIPDDIDNGMTSWTGGLRYEMSSDVMAYGSISRGVKSGAFNTPDELNLSDLVDNLIVRPESVANYELGLKSMLLDGRLRLNATLFYLEYQDMQVSSWDPDGGPTGVGVVRLANAASVESKGFELELTARLTENFTLNAGVGYVDSNFDSFDGFSSPTGGIIDASGNKVPLSPKWTNNLNVQYQKPLVNGSSMEARLDYSFIDEFYSAEGGANLAEELLPSRSIVNGQIAYLTQDQKWRFVLWAKNLTDELKRDAQSFDALITPSFVVRYIEPRTYGFSVTYNF